jgi:chromosome partition protein MukF
LTLLTRTLRAQLAAILGAARKADGEEAWRDAVIGPLRVTVADLVAGIERKKDDGRCKPLLTIDDLFA